VLFTIKVPALGKREVMPVAPVSPVIAETPDVIDAVSSAMVDTAPGVEVLDECW
jgi:hypothetical protein